MVIYPEGLCGWREVTSPTPRPSSDGFIAVVGLTSFYPPGELQSFECVEFLPCRPSVTAEYVVTIIIIQPGVKRRVIKNRGIQTHCNFNNQNYL